MLGHFAEDDPYAKPEQIAALTGHLQAENIQTKFHTYPNTKHWFAEDNRPEYDPDSVQLVWDRTLEFLHTSLRAE